MTIKVCQGLSTRNSKVHLQNELHYTLLTAHLRSGNFIRYHSGLLLRGLCIAIYNLLQIKSEDDENSRTDNHELDL